MVLKKLTPKLALDNFVNQLITSARLHINPLKFGKAKCFL